MPRCCRRRGRARRRAGGKDVHPVHRPRRGTCGAAPAPGGKRRCGTIATNERRTRRNPSSRLSAGSEAHAGQTGGTRLQGIRYRALPVRMAWRRRRRKNRITSRPAARHSRSAAEMTCARRIVAYVRVAAATLSSLPATACPHAFDDRYDLPAPLSYFVAGAAAAVGLSFVVAALFVRSAPPATATQGRVVSLGPLLPVLRAACGFASLILFALTIVSGWFGTGDPMMNLAPTMIWIIWW